MKEIKSNPSKILASYVMPRDTEIVVTSIKDTKTVKFTEIAIMDRPSNGSFIMKDRITDVNVVAKMINKNDDKNVTVSTDSNLNVTDNKEYKALKNIDNMMNVIEMQLDDIEEK